MSPFWANRAPIAAASRFAKIIHMKMPLMTINPMIATPRAMMPTTVPMAARQVAVVRSVVGITLVVAAIAVMLGPVGIVLLLLSVNLAATVLVGLLCLMCCLIYFDQV